MEIISNGKTVRQVLRGMQTYGDGGKSEVYPHKPDTEKPLNDALFEVISYNPEDATYTVDLLDKKHKKTGNISRISANSVEVVDIVGLGLLLEE